MASYHSEPLGASVQERRIEAIAIIEVIVPGPGLPGGIQPSDCQHGGARISKPSLTLYLSYLPSSPLFVESGSPTQNGGQSHVIWFLWRTNFGPIVLILYLVADLIVFGCISSPFSDRIHPQMIYTNVSNMPTRTN